MDDNRRNVISNATVVFLSRKLLQQFGLTTVVEGDRDEEVGSRSFSYQTILN